MSLHLGDEINPLFLSFLLLDVFKFDPDYLANEEKYSQIKKGLAFMI